MPQDSPGWPRRLRRLRRPRIPEVSKVFALFLGGLGYLSDLGSSWAQTIFPDVTVSVVLACHGLSLLIFLSLQSHNYLIMPVLDRSVYSI